MNEPAPRSSNVAVSALFFESLLAVAAIAVGWAIGFSPLEKLPLTSAALPDLGRAALWGLVATLPLFASLYLLEKLPLRSLQRVRAVVDQFISQLLRGASVIDLALLSL